MRSFPTSAEGFTLIELLVTITILGILLASLTQMFTTMTRAMFSAQARIEIVENLNMAASQLAKDLRNIGRNNTLMTDRDGRKYYSLAIVDGDGKYEDSTKVAHNNLATQPNEHSDRLHFITTISNDELDNQLGSSSGDAASERVYFAFWVNGEGSPKALSEMYNRWGIVKRRRFHEKEMRSNGHMIPYYSAEGKYAPWFDANTSGAYHLGLGPFAFNVDYFSIRVYDPQANSGSGGWAESGGASTCAGGSADDGASLLWDAESCNYRYPDAIEFSMRGYDDRANFTNKADDQHVDPVWYKTTISLR